jgi:hypothetical protein
LLSAHIIVSVGWLGTAFAKLVLGLVAVTANFPEYSQNLVVAMEALNVAFPPLAISTIVTGVLLSLGTRCGLLDHYWVVTKIVLTVGVITTAVQLDGRLAQQALAAGSGVALASLAATHVRMLTAATILSVYKPWGPTWFRRRRTPRPSREGIDHIRRTAAIA